MPTWEIEQYEIQTQMYHIEADSEAQAIQRLFDGDGDPVDNSLEYIETATDLGLSAEDHPELTDELLELGVTIHDVIPTIRAIKQVDARCE